MENKDKAKFLYRYVNKKTYDRAGYKTEIIVLHEFNIIKHTPKGYWIGNATIKYSNGMLGSHLYCNRWVSKHGRKRFAYPLKEEALRNFIARKKKEIEFTEYKLTRARKALELAYDLELELPKVTNKELKRKYE